MKRFRYKIEDDLIGGTAVEVDTIPQGFIECPNDMGIDRIFYKIEDSKVMEVIGEGFDETTARRRVEDFLSSLNVNLF